MSGLSIEHKRNFHVVRWCLALLLLTIAALYAYFGIRWYSTGELSPLPMPVSAADASVDETKVSQKQIDSYKVVGTQPRYIEIPALGMSKIRVTKVGLTRNNLLDAAGNINDAGWYAKSVTPGSDAGSVVINGHNAGVGSVGAFAKLSQLKKDDQISVERGDGKVFSYGVYDVHEVTLKNLATSGMKDLMLSADPSKEGLSLITTSGKWIPKDKVFDKSIIVRAVIIE